MYGESWYFIPDLAYPDPYAILPILFVISFSDIPKENGNINGSNTKDDDVCFPSCFLLYDANSFVGSNALHCRSKNIVTNFEQAFVTKRPVVSNNTEVEVIKSDSEKQSGAKKKKRRRKSSTWTGRLNRLIKSSSPVSIPCI